MTKTKYLLVLFCTGIIYPNNYFIAHDYVLAHNQRQQPAFSMPFPASSTLLLSLGIYAGWRLYKRLVHLEQITRKIDITTSIHLKEFRLFRHMTTATLKQHTQQLTHIAATTNTINDLAAQIKQDLHMLSDKQTQEFFFLHQSNQGLQTAIENINKTVQAQHTDLKRFLQAAIDTRQPVTFTQKIRGAIEKNISSRYAE